MEALDFISNLANLLMWGGVVIGIVVTLVAWWLDRPTKTGKPFGLREVLTEYLCDVAYFVSRIVWGFVTCCAVINVICIILIYMYVRIYG